MSTCILCALQGQSAIIHTALDDLESFFWVLIWGIVHASKDIMLRQDALTLYNTTRFVHSY